MNENKQKLWAVLNKKIEFLKCPDSYAEIGTQIEAVETHMSWVFITDKYAYKLKKPVKISSLDLRQLSDRYRNCKKEVNINQDLAPGIYIDCVPLKRDEKRYISIESDEPGEIVDWLVKMKRFPREYTLEQLIFHHRVNMRLLVQAANRLLDFYGKAVPIIINSTAYIKNLRQLIESNYIALNKRKYALEPKLLKKIFRQQLIQLQVLAREIEQRIASQGIIDCHGDLRPEHVCLIKPPIFVDRLEFDATLRQMDPVEELSYLAMECELLGNGMVGDIFLNIYCERTRYWPSTALLNFYKGYRAGLRAKISAWHLDDPYMVDPEKWRDKAKRYLDYSRQIIGA